MTRCLRSRAIRGPRQPFFPAFLSACMVLLALAIAPPASGQTIPAGFNDAQIVAGFNGPVGLTFDNNGRCYVWEKRGKVWMVDNGVRLPDPLIDLGPEIGDWRDHGCLGFALDPNFLANGYIYLLYAVDRHHLLNFGTGAYNAATNEYFNATIMRLTRYTARSATGFTTVDPVSRLVLVGETRKTGAVILHESHSTGAIVFGTDGTLLVSMGDGASYNTTDTGSDPATYFAQALADSILRPAENVGALRAQLLNCMNGKVLRLDPATGNGVPSNPYYDPAQPRSPKSRVWAMGLRNPYRMTMRPGTGSLSAADGDPGTLYIGDVGWNTWEDLNVCYEGGMNFGWPLFEGMDPLPSYMGASTPNLDAPNPLFGQGGCAQQYFYFQDLVEQESLVHENAHPNPCDPSVQIPLSVHTSFHARPAIDWKHGSEQSRCSGFSGTTPVNFDLDASNSPVPGPRFGGSTSVGGAWIKGIGWPVGFQNTYFHSDYASAWVRRFNFNAQDQATAAFDFGTNMGAVVCMKEGPDNALWYIRYETNAVRRIAPIGTTNLPPVAVATQSVQYGPGPLNVTFNAGGSTDPENGPLTYSWTFGDGGTAVGVAAAHTFTAPIGVATSYTVTLTVRDNQNQTNSTTLLVSVNNTPPQVSIISFPNGHQYPVGVDTVYSLEAAVTDLEHGPAQLTYTWRTIFHHNTHVHPEPPVNVVVGSTVISGLGCYEETYYYEVALTVTDAQGLSTTVTHFLYPRCGSIAPTALINSTVAYGTGPLSATLNGSGSVDNGTIVAYAWDLGDGTTATGPIVNKTFTEPGDYQVTLRVTDNDGLVGTAVRAISVLTLEAPQCVGAIGSILREYWLGLSGTAVSALVNSPNYPNAPSGTSFPTLLQGPANFCNNCGARLRGYVIAPETGDYRFTVTSDDNSVFYLSLNADPAYKQAICSVPDWTTDTEFNKYPSQRSAPIALQAGRYYYFEFLQKEGGGDDHMTIRWERPSNSTLTIVPGSVLARWQDCVPSVKLRAELQGPYEVSTGLMRDLLRTTGSIPAMEPFTGLGFTHAGGGGGETVLQARLNITGKNAVVDWVLVELRNKNNPAQIVATRSALLERDGDIIGTNGYGRLLFSVPSDNYYVALRHRNHLGVMSATALPLNKDVQVLDLTAGTTPTFGTNARKAMSDGRFALWTGNTTLDGRIKYTGSGNDRDPVLIQIGGSIPTNVFNGYVQSDLNLDGTVRYTGSGNDRDLILQNIGGTVPTAVRFQQLP